MRLVTVRTERGMSAGRVDGPTIVELAARDVREVLQRQAEGLSVPETGRQLDRASADLAPVIPAPGKIICVGHNYANHIKEMGRDLPAAPTLFAKYAGALIGPYDDILLPPESTQVDWEVELALVIGTTVRRAKGDEAQAAVAAYTVCNDISMRDWQSRTLQWLQGKTFESSTPLGPEAVTADELDASDLEVRCEVDGVVMQQARTSELVFTPGDLVAYASTVITLEPGDVILTGTPGGVGTARKPPVFLTAGSQVRTSIEGIGFLLNTCVAEVVEETSRD
ncbi:MAG: ureidoglycolate lyase [Frankiales bacterium]|nr:ureidoglycolate lyase [Frankiales bacterium]